MYRIAIDTPGKNSRHPQTFDDFDEAVDMALALARHFRGVHIRVFVITRQAIAEHHYTLFDVKFPRLDTRAREAIRREFAVEPAI